MPLPPAAKLLARHQQPSPVGCLAFFPVSVLLRPNARQVAALEVADALNSLGLLLERTGSYQEAESSFREALAILEASPGEADATTAMTLNSLGLYLMTMRGELIFTTFDTDDPEMYSKFEERDAGRYISRCTIPANLLNEGRYVIGVNASSFRVKRYFMDERALAFNVDPTGAPGMHWPERRLGMMRPKLEWRIEEA